MKKSFEISILEAFSSIRPRLEAVVYRRVRCHAVAADVVQETFLRVTKLAPDHAVDDPPAYVHRIAHNLATDRLRDGRRRARAEEEAHHLVWDEADEMTPERVTLGRAELSRLRTILAAMPERTRHIFLMSRFQGRSHREISSILKVSTTTVHNHIRVALERLAQGRDDEAAE